MQSKIQVMIIGKDHEYIHKIINCLSGEPGIQVSDVCHNCLEGIKQTKKEKIDLILLDIEVEGIENTSATSLLLINISNIPIVVFSKDKNNKRLKEALINGADEYITKPYTKNELIKIISHIHEKNCMKKNLIAENYSKTISVFNTKGGVGRSVLSANLSIALKQISEKSVALMDLDFEYGDISLIMNICPHVTMKELEKNQFTLNNLNNEYFVEHCSGVNIFSILNDGTDLKMPNSGLIKLLKRARENYQYVIMDMSPVFNPMNIAALKASDDILLMTTLELSSIKNTVQALKVFKSLNFDLEHIYIILNRFEKDLGISVDEIKSFIGKKDVLMIPEDKKTVIQSVNSGAPFILNKKNTSISKSIIKIANKMMLGNEKWGDRDEKKEIGGRL